MFTAPGPMKIKYIEQWEIEKYADNVCGTGDEPAALTFLRHLAHSGDKIDLSASRGVPS